MRIKKNIVNRDLWIPDNKRHFYPKDFMNLKNNYTNYK